MMSMIIGLTERMIAAEKPPAEGKRRGLKRSRSRDRSDDTDVAMQEAFEQSLLTSHGPAPTASASAAATDPALRRSTREHKHVPVAPDVVPWDLYDAQTRKKRR